MFPYAGVPGFIYVAASCSHSGTGRVTEQCVGQALYSTCWWEMLELLQAGIKGVLNKCPNDKDAI